MAQQVFGPAAVVSVLNRAFTNTSPSNAVFNNQLAQAGTTEASQYAFAESFGATFAVGKTAAELSALVMANMGLDNQLLADALTDYITVHGTNKIGIIAYQLGTLLSPLENDATYGAAAKAWNAEVTAAYEYSADPSNTVPSTSDVNGNEAGKNFVLTTGQDVRTGTSGADFFRGVAGVQVGNQDQTTLNSSDILDGGAGQDTLILNLTGPNYTGGARIKNIETLQIGTNLGLANFDYNVNAGQNEITEVTTIVYDQINRGETLTVNNILKTGEALPTLAWKNEAGSQAGTVFATYRASAVAGATDQAVELHNVMAVNTVAATGSLVIGNGVETLTITSTGTTANTLNASTNFDGRNADLVSGSNDGVPDNGVLTKVVVKGDQAFGRAATVVTNDVFGEANFGLTNRAAASDLGRNDNLASASNLISVAGTVTEIDATEADGGVAMRFVGRADNGAVNVTFQGGKAADYIEFERGNVNAAGGEGNDTFAFINNNLTSFDFGSADSIVGGAGVDTIQLGVNGIGSVVANTTEFNNKTGIDVLDLRGATNNVTLADAFVAAADAGTMTVRTDKIVQTSDAVTANATPSLAANNRAAEDNSVNTIVLTELADNRAIKFIGGSGKDQVVVDNASANQFTELDGGSNTGLATTGTLGFNDSLTVVNTAVLDDNDVKNIKNFEFVNLVETIVGNSNFTVTLSEAFVLGNANGLVIGSTTGTFGQRLGAGDVVNIEVSDLQTAAGSGVLKASLAARTINVTDLLNAGVTVNYQVNGVTVSSGAAVPAFLAGRIVTGLAPDAAIVDDVPGSVAPVFNILGTAAADALVVAAAGDNVQALAGNDTITLAAAVVAPTGFIDGGDGTDTLVLSGASTNLSGATLSGIESLTVGAASPNTTSMTAAQYSGFTTITAANTADTLTLTTAGTLAFGANAAGVAGFETVNLANGTNIVTFSGAEATAQAFVGGTGSDSFTTTAANLVNRTITAGTGTDSLTVTDVLAANFGTAATDGLDVYNLQGIATGATLTGSNGAGVVYNVAGASAGTAALVLGTGGQTVNSTTTGAISFTSNTGVDTFNLGAGAEVIVTTGSLFGQVGGFDTVTGFKVAGADQFKTGVAATSLNNLTIATADTTTLAAAIQTAATAAGATLAANTQAYFITVNAGAAAGTYAFQNIGGTTASVDATDFIVKLTGTTGAILAGDFVV